MNLGTKLTYNGTLLFFMGKLTINGHVPAMFDDTRGEFTKTPPPPQACKDITNDHHR